MCSNVFVSYLEPTFCPNGSVYSDGECIYVDGTKASYPSAKEFCQTLNGRPVQIRDRFENSFVQRRAQANGVNDQAYIGVIKASNGIWTYDDGTPLKYRNWKSGHPESNSSCAVLDTKDDQWLSVNCDENRHFVCSTPNRRSCPTTNWYYEDGIGCVTFTIFKTGWENASSYCHESDSWMISASNEATQSYIKYHTSGLNNWIGLFRVDNNWFWDSKNSPTPLTNSSYQNWIGGVMPPVDPGNNCAIMDGDGYWVAVDCDNPYYFVCQQDSQPSS